MSTTPDTDDLVPQPEPDEEYEIIKHPKHYNSHPAGIECITVIEPMSFNIGTSIKHMWRAGLKPGMDMIDDLKKAAEYLQFEIDRIERMNTERQVVGVIQTGQLVYSDGAVRLKPADGVL